MIDAVRQQLADDNAPTAREETYFGGARLNDDELRDAAEDDRQRRAAERARRPGSDRQQPLPLGHDIRAALADPSCDQLSALREIVWRLLCEHHPELIAYGAG
jgi:hypothetical protein